MRLQLVLQSIESRDKFFRRHLQRAFRVEIAFPRQINHCEQQIAGFVRNRLSILGRDCRFCFAKLLLNFRNHVAQLAPIEIHPRRL